MIVCWTLTITTLKLIVPKEIMKVIMDSNIEASHLSHLFDMLKTLELKEGTLSLLEIKYPKDKVVYTIFHNKASFKVSGRRVDNGN